MRKVTFLSPGEGDVIIKGYPAIFSWDSFAIGRFQLLLRPQQPGSRDILIDRSVYADGSKTVSLNVSTGVYGAVAKDLYCGVEWTGPKFEVVAPTDQQWLSSLYDSGDQLRADLSQPRPKLQAKAYLTLSHEGCAVTCLQNQDCLAFSFTPSFGGCALISFTDNSLRIAPAVNDIPDAMFDSMWSIHILKSAVRLCQYKHGCSTIQTCESSVCGRCPPEYSLVKGNCSKTSSTAGKLRHNQPFSSLGIRAVTPGCECLNSAQSKACGDSKQYNSACEALCLGHHMSTYLGTCLVCGPGLFARGGFNTCQVCPKGFYSSQAKNDACMPCPAGQSAEPGSALCSTNCDSVCPNDVSPVCATNGLQYQNQCIAVCKNQYNFHRGVCQQHGVLRNEGAQCLDAVLTKEVDREPLMWPCDNSSGTQRWIFQRELKIIREENGVCLDGSGALVIMFECQPDNPAQQWDFNELETTIRHSSGKCLAAQNREKPGSYLVLEACDNAKKNQRWFRTDNPDVKDAELTSLPTTMPIVVNFRTNAATRMCMTQQPSIQPTKDKVVMNRCNSSSAAQHWAFVPTTSMGTDGAVTGYVKDAAGMCLSASTQMTTLMFTQCASMQTKGVDLSKWLFDPRRGLLSAGGKCLEAMSLTTEGKEVVLSPCDQQNTNQHFYQTGNTLSAVSYGNTNFPILACPSSAQAMLCCGSYCSSTTPAPSTVCLSNNQKCYFTAYPGFLFACKTVSTLYGDYKYCANDDAWWGTTGGAGADWLTATKGEFGPGNQKITISPLPLVAARKCNHQTCGECVADGCVWAPANKCRKACDAGVKCITDDAQCPADDEASSHDFPAFRPRYVAVNTVQKNSARLVWASPRVAKCGSNDKYTVQWSKLGSDEWSHTGTSFETVLLTGLSPKSTYRVNILWASGPALTSVATTTVTTL